MCTRISPVPVSPCRSAVIFCLLFFRAFSEAPQSKFALCLGNLQGFPIKKGGIPPKISALAMFPRESLNVAHFFPERVREPLPYSLFAQ